jgi:hypothetical protein
MLTAEFVRSLLEYNPDTGTFVWRARGKKFWDNCHAGKNAGSICSTGHLRISILDRGYFAHRLAWLIMTGEHPVNEIDHKDGNPANNKWDNIRAATRQQNQQNRRRHSSNSSGFKGVFKNRIGVTWSAQIYCFGKKIHIGCYPTAEMAHEAYCEAAKKNYGEFARTA